MRGAIIYGAGDVRCEERPDPLIIEPTDAIVRAAATCVCGSDLWRYRGTDEVTQPRAIGHEYCGVVERVGMVGWVGAPHGVDVSMVDTFWRNVGVRDGPAPVRHYLPDLLDRVWNRRIDPGKVFDMELPLEQVGDAYRAMDERRGIKVLLSV
jgi:threonine dehydrogenase-like Zn-dependent dehydrogenase